MFSIQLFIAVLSIAFLSEISGIAQFNEPSSLYGPPGYTAGVPIASQVGECRNTDLERNRRLVMDFYQTALRDKRPDLMVNFLAEDYLNHNPFSSRRGRQDFVDILTVGVLSQEPPQTVDFRRVDAIGDVVWVHCSLNIGGRRFSAFDIFQINCDGLIQEHWDALQDTTSVQTMNPVPFF